jgi:phosphohistidine swiveling domain-containing protein
MPDIRTFDEIGPGDGAAVGGKGLSLGLLARAALPVPPGFCVTSDAYRAGSITSELRQSIIENYHRLGSGPVAVRSSATAEDGAATSFAGQQETYLGIIGDDAVCDAVERCWQSLQSERARAYRERQGVTDMAMAVVVQCLVAAESAGVLFTRDPMDPESDRMLIEASWGLGETVVNGRVTPDRFVVSRTTDNVIDRQLGQKTVERLADGEHPVDADRQAKFCLTDEQLKTLAELGKRVEEHEGGPRDIEWAWADGRAWLLQARPITTAGAGERDKVRREEIESLRAKADPAGTVWGRFNLSEVLSEPTPMTWAIVHRFLSGSGGYGRMYADLGFPPPPEMANDCGYDLICGRPYMNLSREPRLQWGDLPVTHDFAALKADPAKTPYSAAEFRAESASFWTKMRSAWRILKGGWKYQAALSSFAERFRKKLAPEFIAETTTAMKEDWSALEPPALLDKLRHWTERTLVEFARHSLKPTVFAAGSLANIQRMLDKALGPDGARRAAAELGMGARPDADADLAAALRDVALQEMDRAKFIEEFGHRGSREMELSAPRWAEDSAALDQVLRSANHSGHLDAGLSALDRVAAQAKFVDIQKLALRGETMKLHTALGLRETGKHHLLRGYALIRRALVELDRRFGLNGGIFFLTPDELPRLIAREDLNALITERRKRRSIALSLDVPPVLFSDDLDAIGRPAPPPEGADVLHGVSLSAGVAEGPAMVLTDPRAAPPALNDFILVCPSTDPSWVPLFARARGLIMETGGVLSHGAIVAREFGLPAVAGVPDIVRRLKTGQRVRVDGSNGTVAII